MEGKIFQRRWARPGDEFVCTQSTGSHFRVGETYTVNQDCKLKDANGYPHAFTESLFLPATTAGTKTNKYSRKLTNQYGDEITVDVYDVIEGFNITCPAMQHAVKKMLNAGLRGHKDTAEDLDDIGASIERAKQLHKWRKK